MTWIVNNSITRDELCQFFRGMAWERIKGELNSLSAGDYPPQHGGKVIYDQWQEKCEKRREAINKFIQEMEDDELY